MNQKQAVAEAKLCQAQFKLGSTMLASQGADKSGVHCPDALQMGGQTFNNIIISFFPPLAWA